MIKYYSLIVFTRRTRIKKSTTTLILSVIISEPIFNSGEITMIPAEESAGNDVAP
jgi:hypothetical protein